MNWIYVFIGGGIGAALRWGVVSMFTTSNGFPAGTLMVNLVGCLLIGILSAFLVSHELRWGLLLITGLLGGFTTFASFGLDLYRLMQNGQMGYLITYFTLSNVVGLLLVIIGHRLTLQWIG